MQSARKDKRGHWPQGKRRHPAGQWSRIRLGVARLIESEHQLGLVSMRALADVLGVSDRTVRRWMDGTDRPDAETQELVSKWLDEHRKRIKARGN